MAKWASLVFNTRKVYGNGYYSDSEMWKTIFSNSYMKEMECRVAL